MRKNDSVCYYFEFDFFVFCDKRTSSGDRLSFSVQYYFGGREAGAMRLVSAPSVGEFSSFISTN